MLPRNVTGISVLLSIFTAGSIARHGTKVRSANALILMVTGYSSSEAAVLVECYGSSEKRDRMQRVYADEVQHRRVLIRSKASIFFVLGLL